jgi:hypothetical protein
VVLTNENLSRVNYTSTFEERFEYLRCYGIPSKVTFGDYRLLNQMLYRSPIWKKLRQRVILRDNGCDLAIPDRPIGTEVDSKYGIHERIIIHHINPITIEQVANNDPIVYDLNNLICTSHNTHEAIHYSDASILIPSKPTQRHKGDTKLW